MKIYLFNIMQFYEQSDRTVNKSIMYFNTRFFNWIIVLRIIKPILLLTIKIMNDM